MDRINCNNRIYTAANLLLVVSLFVFSFIFTNPAQAGSGGGNGGPAPGSLDKVATTDFGGYDVAYALAIQPEDGKIVTAGATTPAGSDYSSFALTRHFADGTLDTSFGSEGKVISIFGPYSSSINGVAIQADGKIVAVGQTSINACNPDNCNWDFAVARYNPDGSPDMTFGVEGKTVISFGIADDMAYEVAIQPADGKIVIAGHANFGGSYNWTGYGDFALVRLNPDGTPDPSFDADGKTAIADIGPAQSVLIQANGMIVAAGGGYAFKLARFTDAGALDSGFGSSGIATVNVTNKCAIFSTSGAYDIIQQADGKFVAVGWVGIHTGRSCSGTHVALARFNLNGTLDSRFGIQGTLTTMFPDPTYGGLESARSVVIQADDKILVSSANNFIRYNPSGALDNSFGGTGIISALYPGQPRTLKLQADGKFVIANGYNNFLWARYNP